MKKTTSVVIPFFHYHSTSKKTSRILFNFFLKHLKIWRDEVDKVYIIDSGDFIPETEGLEIIKMPRQSHWENLNQVMRQIKEDKFIILDSDTVIYRKGVIKGIFKDLDRYHVVSILDNSGTNLDKKHKPLRENENRLARQRLCPYLFGCQTDFFKLLDFDFTPRPAEGYQDSMSKITDQIFNQKPRFKELPDNRWTLYYNEGDYKWFNFSMDQNKRWYDKQDLGYYHLRNIGLALYTWDSFNNNEEAYRKIIEITPLDELLRIMAWFYFISGKEHCLLTDDYLDAYKEKYKWLKEL